MTAQKRSLRRRLLWAGLSMFLLSACDPGRPAADIAAWHRTATLPGAFHPVAFCGDDEIAAVRDERLLQIFSAKDGQAAGELDLESLDPFAVSCSPNGRWIAIAGLSKHLVLIERESLKVVATIDESALRIDWAPDSIRLLTVEFDKVRLRSVPDLEVQGELRGHAGEISAARFSPDGTEIATSGHDATVRLWTLDGLKERAVLKGHPDSATDVVYSPGGKTLASAGIVTRANDSNVYLWDVKSASVLFPLKHSRDLRFIDFAADGQSLLTGTVDSVQSWDVATGKMQWRTPTEQYDMGPVAVSPNRRRVASYIDPKKGTTGIVIWEKTNAAD